MFETANVAVDHNQLTMEVMKKVADRRGFACLLHEKPFAGVNGSGKHNNWSIQTNTGINLLDPGKHPAENIRFLVFLMAVISAVDEYADILRVSVASAGNDHRLGANEAPPAIISVFVGDELAGVLKSIEEGKEFNGVGKTQMEMGAEVLPHIMRDTTDRNRTSPFAFTGNKFEFRMPGSAISVANANIVLNTAVAESLERIYEKLKDVPSDKLDEEIHALLKKLLDEHKRVIFNGNGYTDEWVEEAEKRGLDNLKSLPAAMPRWISEKSIDLFTKHKIFTKEEIFSRYEILLENYSKTIHIESLTLQEMVRKDFMDGLIGYQSAVAEEAGKKKALIPDLNCALETHITQKLDCLSAKILKALDRLAEDTEAAEKKTDALECAAFYQETVLSDMEVLRSYVDIAESMIPESFLPYPTYGEMLFSLR
jgi:glutamine synthetase